MKYKNYTLNTQKVVESIFIALTGVYLLWQFSTRTTFFIQVPSLFNRVLFGSLVFVVFLKICCKRLSLKKIGICITVFLAYLLVYLNDRYPFLLYTAIIIIGLEDIDYRRILKLYLFTVGIGFAVTALAGITSTITNYIYVRA